MLRILFFWDMMVWQWVIGSRHLREHSALKIKDKQVTEEYF